MASMNRHFQRDYPSDWDVPSAVYARLDHVELPTPGEWTVLLAFDAVDARWFATRAMTDTRFDLDHPDSAIAEQAARPIKPLLSGQGVSLFDDAPLFRIEVEHPIGQDLFGYGTPDFVDTGRSDTGLGALEDAWFAFDLGADQVDGASAAAVYPTLFGQARSAYLKGTMPSVQQGKALSGIFSLLSLPSISTPQLESKLSVAKADLLAVYDVGQGNSNALLEENLGQAAPTLYFDLGAGVYRNQHTTPPNLVFCFTYTPPIVLSHWDADHWAGAFASSTGGSNPYPALLQDWYAPLQTVGPVHVAFAHQVIAAGGSMSTYTASAGTVGTAGLGATRELRFVLGSGTDRNNTGIAVAVEDTSLGPPRSWLLTGDCDYKYFVPHLNPEPPVGLVVPHHGADLASGVAAPSPVALPNGYCRVLYSFGAGNKHGRKQHPTAAGMNLHVMPGWNHGAWTAAAPGAGVAGGDVLATETHGALGASGTKLGGCLVGWDHAPAPVAAPCGGSGPVYCTISPIQA